MKSAVWTYSGCNLGDDIQTVACIDYNKLEDPLLIDRDNMQECKEEVELYCNGWLRIKDIHFPPPPNIHPIYQSIHVTIDSEFTPHVIEHFKKFEPIGCRDLYTLDKLKSLGIEVYYQKCLTLSLKNEFDHRDGRICIVDVRKFPVKIKPADPIELYSHNYWLLEMSNIMPYPQERLALARETIIKYSTAKEVITGRLHALLPCRALNTPVTFLHNNLKDERFSGYNC